MAKVKFDVRGVEDQDMDFDTPVPKGLYRAVIDEIDAETPSKRSGNPMLSVTYKISRGDFKGRLAWDYIVLDENNKWKLKRFLTAVGLVGGKKERGEFDPSKIEGTEVQIRIKHEDDEEYGLRHKVSSVLPMPEDEDGDDLDDEEDDEEEEDDEDEGTDSDLTLDDLKGMDRAELKTLIKDEELSIRVTKSKKDDALRDEIAEALELEEDDEDEESDDEEEEDYNEWSNADLKAELKDRGLKTSGTKSALVTRLETDDEDDDGDGDEPF